MTSRLEELLARYVEHHVLHGERLAVEDLCADDPELAEALLHSIADYERALTILDAPSPDGSSIASPEPVPLPTIPGFRTIERLASGGSSDVYKLVDLELGRTVVAKVLRPDHPLRATTEDFLREARSLALFEDQRIVRIIDFRADDDPPVILMEHVDGFELGEIGPSLEPGQKARVMAEVAEAIHRAHSLGIVHRDLKPGNILLDASLKPRILDFGLSSGERHAGHGLGTPSYMAPEQLDPRRPIDARSDVYALGVILYQLLCGVPPFAGASEGELLDAIRSGEPRLPAEIEPEVPEPLQAIALKAMEREPRQRYPSAREMALELRRYLEGRPVLARPSLYRSALGRRLRPHIEEIREWLRLKLVYPHEAEDLTSAYARLEARDDDWIVASRALSLSMISLYLGAFLLVCGGLLYFDAYLREAFTGLLRPLLVLGLPLIGLHIVAGLLFRRERRAVAVAFFLAAGVLLPLFLLILLPEAGLWPPPTGDANQLFADSWVSNRQLQAASLVSCAWACWLALSTRTMALSTTCTALLTVLHLSLLADLGLRTWLEEGRWDILALHLLPLLLVVAALGRLAEARDHPWFARPLYFAGVGLYALVLELLALDGRAFHHLGVSMAALQGSEVSDPLLLDTLAAMTCNGLLIYGAGWLLDRHGTALLRAPARLLLTISPFAILEPIFYLNQVGEYSRRFDWIYLGLAITIAFLSHFRQRKSFYYAGLVNTGCALWLITDHYDWFDRPLWAAVVVAVGLATLAAGYGLDSLERSRRQS